jgi:hypothetical protein
LEERERWQALLNFGIIATLAREKRRLNSKSRTRVFITTKLWIFQLLKYYGVF